MSTYKHLMAKRLTSHKRFRRRFLGIKEVWNRFFFVFLQSETLIEIINYIMEITITEENFDEVLKNNPVVMVDFGATWCGPCKALAPVVEEIANEYEGRAAVGKADVDQCPSVTARFRIRNVPTVLFFQNGELKDKSVGAVQKKTLTDKIDALL